MYQVNVAPDVVGQFNGLGNGPLVLFGKVNRYKDVVELVCHTF
jgi:hypothetical protein